MEKAIFITRAEGVSHWKEEYSRIYFGQEFCERLIPTTPELVAVLDFCLKKGVAFTFVTPFLTEEYFERWRDLLLIVEQKLPGGEVVVNDWGFLYALRGEKRALMPVLGRLLCKQKRGPQILRIMDRVPQTMLEHFRRSNVDVPILREFLQELGIIRIELDNLLHGTSRDSCIPGSLYYPYGYITTTRLCLSNSCDHREYSLRAIFPCGRECRKYTFRLTHRDMPVPIILKGNAQFYTNEKIPENLVELGIDRLVYEPEVPI